MIDLKLLAQVEALQSKYSDCIILFEVGAEYKAYKKDAEEVSNILGTKIINKAGVLVTGFPANAIDRHLKKLVKAGNRVAVATKLLTPSTMGKSVKRNISNIE